MKEIILKLLEIREQFQIMHWQTKSYARHKAYDMYFSELSGLTDNLAESYQGKYGKIVLDSPVQLNLQDISQLDLNAFLDGIMNLLTTEFSSGVDEADTDLANIRDEMIALTNKLKYLLTLE